jgi:MFS family permease
MLFALKNLSLCGEGETTDKKQESTGYASRNFVVLMVIIFTAIFASSMVSASPVFFLVREFVKTEESTATIFGVLVSVSSVAMITANFAGGFLADKIGRKSVIALGPAILAPSLFAYTLVPDVFWVIAVYFVQMFAVSLSQPAFTAFIADLSKVSSRGKAFGHYNLFMVGATIPAPLLGGYLADTMGLRFPFVIATPISLIALVASFGLVQISVKTTSAENAPVENKVEDAIMPFATVMLIFGAIGFSTGVLNGMLSPLFRIYPMFKLGVNATELGLAFSIGTGLVTALVQLPGGRLTDKVGRKPIMLFSMLGVPFIVAIAYTRSLFEFILASAGLVAFGNLSSPAYYAWQMDLVPGAKRARTSGLINAITGIGMFIGPFLSMWLYQSQPNIVLPFVATAMPGILQIPLILKLKETKTA